MARLKIVILITIVFLILMTLWWASSLAKARANTEQRLGDIHQIQQALRYYFEENGLYPYGLGLPSGIGAYIDHWPIPPEAIGACRTEDNVYFYAPQNSRDDYSVTFCLGVANEGFGAGLHTLSVKGIK